MILLARLVVFSIFLAMLATSVLADTKNKTAPSQMLIKNVNIFDGKNEKLKTNMSVLVEDNLIKKIGKHLKSNDNATVIDGGGRTLMPGLSSLKCVMTF